MRIAVTGRHGQIAQSLLERAQASKVDILTVSRPEVDLARPESVEAALIELKPDAVVSAAAYTAVDLAESEPALAHDINATGAGAVATAPHAGLPQHPRLSYWTGSSIDQEIVAEARKAAGDGRTMVVLDSDHSTAHVLQEIMSYRGLVQVGDYLIVEDTNINGHPTYPDFGSGPMEAIERFLAETDEFVSDTRCERFLMTCNPKGYLKRVRPER
jgi:cephalosporin hydroxylase